MTARMCPKQRQSNRRLRELSAGGMLGTGRRSGHSMNGHGWWRLLALARVLGPILRKYRRWCLSAQKSGASAGCCRLRQTCWSPFPPHPRVDANQACAGRCLRLLVASRAGGDPDRRCSARFATSDPKSVSRRKHVPAMVDSD